jgi:hypothetical protein
VLENLELPLRPISSEHLFISTLNKEAATTAHLAWLEEVTNALIIYTDRSRNDNGQVSSGWCIFDSSLTLLDPLLKANCRLGPYSTVEDRETHAIHENLISLQPDVTLSINICIDNQNCIRAIGDQPVGNNEYLSHTQAILQSLHHHRWTVHHRWTPIHCDILGNELADSLAKSSPPDLFSWSRTTVSWLRL